ncbi:MAG TPA: patatin-like phospholipase family protein [Nitrososphaeraceae archaeon]|nr:patatin-like phospholipase family protein [Nitrososphaeraceae archaeon]
MSITTTASKKRKQRALVMQGGGALGAYEAGVYRILYGWISENLERQDRTDENVFDVIAGTSIGAINAAIIISHVSKNKKQNPSWTQLKCWEGSADKLEEFWTDQIASTPDLSITSYDTYYQIWNDVKAWRDIYPQAATAEAARRYYSAKAFLYGGAKNVLQPIEGQFPLYDNKFFDNNRLDDINNLWFRCSNHPLEQSVKKYVLENLKTDFAKNEPRLLMCSVDVEEGETVVFDSYSDKSEYAYDTLKKQYKYTIKYSEGIMVEHIMASACIPLLFDYQRVPKGLNGPERGGKQEGDNQMHENSRLFWDGGLLSNTPIRELISKHKLFWETKTMINNGGKSIFEMREEAEDNESKRQQYTKEVFNVFWREMMTRARSAAADPRRFGREEETQQPESELKADDLDIFVVNLWPRNETPLPLDDYDLTKDRMFDIMNYDKTQYDLKVATFVTDYIELARDLVQQLAKDAVGASGQEGAKKEVARKILLNDSKTKSKFRDGTPRAYLDLMTGRFDVNEKLRIERTENNETTISNKWTDLSHQTISQLIDQGKKDTIREISNKPIPL